MNIRHRAAQIKADCHLVTAPGKGTKWTIRLNTLIPL